MLLAALLGTSATLPFMHGSRMAGGSYRVPGSQSFTFTPGSGRPARLPEMRYEWQKP